MTFPEINREARGHAFYEGLEDLPDMMATDSVETDKKIVHAHYFNGRSDWWIVELDQKQMVGYGYACLNGATDLAEWGDIDLIALESNRSPGIGTLIERDLDWVPTEFANIKPRSA